MKKPEASIVIPVLNEKRNIGEVLKKIPRKYEVIVVDDGSEDNTKDVVKAFGFKPVVLDKHSGKGRACLAGAEKAKSDFIIFMDGDGQHDPKGVGNIVSMLKRCDLVIGTRDYSKIPLHRQLTNKMANEAVSLITGKQFNDVQCGFRGIRKNKLKKLLLGSRGYEFEIDMIVGAALKKMRICEVPINVFYKIPGTNDKIGSRMSKRSSIRLASHLAKSIAKHKIKNMRIK